MLRVLVQCPHHKAQPYDLWPRTKDGHDLHNFFSKLFLVRRQETADL